MSGIARAASLLFGNQRMTTKQLKTMREQAQRRWEERLTPCPVLIVDDEPEFCELLIARLEPWNCTPLVAYSCHEAVHQLMENPRIQAAILDVVLPDGSGPDVYRWIVSNRPDLNTIFVTGYPTSECEAEIRHIGPARIASKDRLTTTDYFSQLMMQLKITKKA